MIQYTLKAYSEKDILCVKFHWECEDLFQFAFAADWKNVPDFSSKNCELFLEIKSRVDSFPAIVPGNQMI